MGLSAIRRGDSIQRKAQETSREEETNAASSGDCCLGHRVVLHRRQRHRAAISLADGAHGGGRAARRADRHRRALGVAVSPGKARAAVRRREHRRRQQHDRRRAGGAKRAGRLHAAGQSVAVRHHADADERAVRRGEGFHADLQFRHRADRGGHQSRHPGEKPAGVHRARQGRRRTSSPGAPRASARSVT